MIEAELNGREILDKRQLHDRLALELGFPPWYGSNLDALYDCLMDIREDTELEILNYQHLREHLGVYCDRLLHVLGRAEKENGRFFLKGISCENPPA